MLPKLGILGLIFAAVKFADTRQLSACSNGSRNPQPLLTPPDVVPRT